MFKQVVAIIAMSIVVIMAMPYVQQGLQFILTAHNWVADTLVEVFSGGQTGNLIRNLLALLAIPVVVALVPTIIYWITRRSWFPYFMELVWVVWLMQTAALVVLFNGTAA